MQKSLNRLETHELLSRQSKTFWNQFKSLETEVKQKKQVAKKQKQLQKLFGETQYTMNTEESENVQLISSKRRLFPRAMSANQLARNKLQMPPDLLRKTVTKFRTGFNANDTLVSQIQSLKTIKKLLKDTRKFSPKIIKFKRRN